MDERKAAPSGERFNSDEDLHLFFISILRTPVAGQATCNCYPVIGSSSVAENRRDPSLQERFKQGEPGRRLRVEGHINVRSEGKAPGR